MEESFSENHPERPRSFPNIHFEAGDHDFKYGDQLGWNPEIKQVLAATSPKVLTIDGLMALSCFGQPFTWEGNELSGLGLQSEFSPNSRETLLVYGDPGRLTFGKYTQEIINNFWHYQHTISRETNETLISQTRELNESMREKATASFTDEGLANVAPIMLCASGLLLLETKYHQRMSRRQFLRGMLKTPLWLGLAGSGIKLPAYIASTSIATYQTNPNQRQIAERISDITKPYFQNLRWWENGRTALLIAKTEDAIVEADLDHSTPAVVLMGNNHAANSPGYLTEQHKQDESISTFMENYWGALQAILEDAKIDQEFIQESRDHIKNLLAYTDVATVTSEHGKNEGTFFTSFKSKQVLAAIS